METLLTIPLELLVSISSFLSTPDLGSLRLTCKHVEKSLYEWFSKEFFTKKQFMLTQPSLQALVDISRHAGFSQKLTHVILATNVYDEIPLQFRDEAAGAAYIEGYADQKALMSSGADREMLTEAFRNLENLHTVGIRDFNSESRTRDGVKASWSSWGAPTVRAETGIDMSFSFRGPFTPDNESRFVSHMFSTLVYALGRAHRTTPQIEVLLRRNGLPDSSFHIPAFFSSTITPVLQNLDALLLNLDLASRRLHTYSNGIPMEDRPGRSLRKFLSFTPNLTHLRLNFHKHQFVNTEDFLQWLSEPMPAAASGLTLDTLRPAPIALPLLKQLEFGQLNVVPDTLLAVIAKFAPTLTDLSLWRTSLSAPGVPYSDKPNLWFHVIRKLVKIPHLELTHLKVGMLSQDQHLHVNFSVDGSKESQLKVREYSGKKMESFLKELAVSVVVQWPVDPPSDDGNSDEDEEMDDDDNDDGDDVTDGDGDYEE
ncbi:hypothetical protein P153DRAFT_128465 [Dothidotthia symphoricarpi CBS 119687]|uniref:F-box domain-containing protein n=1 Tax=Dothidotthia symphoricarpi CBS 119687 TaxID=1392245 RepID=A0A6A5ZZ24_9PLEO|nr:uncharacterized protein P153DRAFT_128465 [Dothidotthia symphoricarpi CBS 119687]KAF2124819.1 hypothetical protein P153DRAFT_128465 [Dothidotthia symphoricarpi CBS 119687]